MGNTDSCREPTGGLSSASIQGRRRWCPEPGLCISGGRGGAWAPLPGEPVPTHPSVNQAAFREDCALKPWAQRVSV